MFGQFITTDGNRLEKLAMASEPLRAIFAFYPYSHFKFTLIGIARLTLSSQPPWVLGVFALLLALLFAEMNSEWDTLIYD